MTRYHFWCAVVFLLAPTFCRLTYADPLQLVVVTNKSSAFQTLTDAEIRKIYLGNQRAHRGVTIRPLFNNSKKHIREAFLQKTIFMSERTYRHYAADRALGREEKIKLYRSEAKLLGDLQAVPNSISFIPAASAAKLGFVKIVAKL